MKKVIATAIILTMVLSTALAGCQKDSADKQEIVTLVWPLEIVAESREDFDEEEFLEQNEGFTQLELNENEDTVTVSIEEDTFNFIKTQFNETYAYSLAQLVETEPTDYIKDINYDSEFRNIKIKVVKDELEQDEEFAENLLQIIAINIAQYHQITGQETTNSLELIDNENSETISSLLYPDDLVK